MQKYDEYKKDIKILCIEDEALAGIKLVKMLSKYYNEIILAKNGEEALEIYRDSYVSSKPIDLVITDIDMPKIDGIELLECIRKFDEKLPFIYVTAKLDVEILLKLIKLDIVDYIQKPLDIDELLKTINNVILNKYKVFFFNEHHTEHILNIGENLFWNNDTKTLTLNNEIIKLTKYELNLVNYLVNNHNKVVTTENLVDEIWEDSLSTSNNLNLKNLISRLKTKVPKLNIENIYGLGYKIRIHHG